MRPQKVKWWDNFRGRGYHLTKKDIARRRRQQYRHIIVESNRRGYFQNRYPRDKQDETP